LIVHRILTLFGSQTGLLGSGRIGVHWELQEERGDRFYLVRELRSGLPAEKAGLRVGDRVIGCNGSALADARTERDAKRICQVESGRMLQLDVRREDQLLDVQVIAEKRPGL
jgi:predicted metalloprotease with PDZ domain